MRPPRLIVPALAIVLGCLACGVGEPRVRTAATLAGDWVMTEREGKPLPNTTRFPLNRRMCTSHLIRNVVTLRADGTFAEQGESRAWCDGDPPPDSSWVFHSGGRFELRGPRGDTIVFADTAAPAGETQRGVFSGNAMNLSRFVPSPPRTVRYRYERVGASR